MVCLQVYRNKNRRPPCGSLLLILTAEAYSFCEPFQSEGDQEAHHGANGGEDDGLQDIIGLDARKDGKQCSTKCACSRTVMATRYRHDSKGHHHLLHLLRSARPPGLLR